MSAALTTEEVARLLESTGALLEGEVAALSEDDARWHPAPGEWCVNEVIGHMIESEKRGFFGRITRTLEQEGRFEEPWDQLAVARERSDCERTASSLLTEWMGIRRRSVEMVKGLRPDQISRTCRHGKVGELSVRDLLHEWVHHDRNHTRQLLANVQERAWPHMGNAQKFKGE